MFTHALPTLVPILRRTTSMAVRVPHAMSPGLSTSIAEVAAMFDSAFLEDNEEKEDDEEDDEEEDEDIEESLDFDSEIEDAEDEGPTAEDEDPTTGDECLATRDKGPGMRVERLGLGGDLAIPEGQQRPAPVVETAMEPERPQRVSAFWQPTLTTWIDLEDGMAYIDVPAYPPSAPHVQTPPSPEWSSCQMDAQRAALWHAISDTQMENWELRLQIIEERRARLDLAKIFDSMRRGPEPNGDL
ncbi:hypothetical protein Tco_0831709 [Tanacetum coccineum]